MNRICENCTKRFETEPKDTQPKCNIKGCNKEGQGGLMICKEHSERWGVLAANMNHEMEYPEPTDQKPIWEEERLIKEINDIWLIPGFKSKPSEVHATLDLIKQVEKAAYVQGYKDGSGEIAADVEALREQYNQGFERGIEQGRDEGINGWLKGDGKL